MVYSSQNTVYDQPELGLFEKQALSVELFIIGVVTTLILSTVLLFISSNVHTILGIISILTIPISVYYYLNGSTNKNFRVVYILFVSSMTFIFTMIFSFTSSSNLGSLILGFPILISSAVIVNFMMYNDKSNLNLKKYKMRLLLFALIIMVFFLYISIINQISMAIIIWMAVTTLIYGGTIFYEYNQMDKGQFVSYNKAGWRMYNSIYYLYEGIIIFIIQLIVEGDSKSRNRL